MCRISQRQACAHRRLFFSFLLVKRTFNNMANVKLEKAEKLRAYFWEKEAFFSQKWEKARKSEKRAVYWEAYKKYRPLARRANDLTFLIDFKPFISRTRGHSFLGESTQNSRVHALREWEERKLKKQERAKEFERSYRIFLWHMQEHLHADYGTFKCEHCGWEFHHSPREVYYGAKKVHSCICGNCASNYLEKI